MAQGLGQTLGQGINEYNNQGSSYDQLNNIANQLQQYAFGTGSSGSSFNPSAGGYANSPSVATYNSGSYGLSGDATGTGYGPASASNPSSASFAPGSDGTNPYAQSGPVSNFSPAAAAAAAAAAAYGAAGQIPYQPGGFNPYAGQPNYGNFQSTSTQQSTYEPATSGYRKYGLGSLLMPMLALAGISLLIPTVTSLSTAAGRKKRSTDPAKESALGSYVDRLERYYTLYKTAVEREECMNRIICELGDAMSTVRGKSTLFT